MYMYKEPRKMFVGVLVGELVLQHDCIQSRITVHKTIIVPAEFRCWMMKSSAMLTTSPTDLLALYAKHREFKREGVNH